MSTSRRPSASPPECQRPNHKPVNRENFEKKGRKRKKEKGRGGYRGIGLSHPQAKLFITTTGK